MINTEDFTKRLQKVIDFYEETASSFAEKIGVQRSSISHILSGRNKPSLDFVMKVLQAYPEIELYWLMNGKGKFPKEATIETPLKELSIKQNSLEPIHSSITPEIEKIIIFYKDGSFKNYEN